MTPDEERYMAFTGLIQWTDTIVRQARRIEDALAEQRRPSPELNMRLVATLNFHCQCHFFAIAAYKLIEYRKWAAKHGLFGPVDFSEIDAFSVQDIKDLRDMREHVIEYFSGIGRVLKRWIATGAIKGLLSGRSPTFRADASSVVGTMIGGRLDYAAFSAAAERLLPHLLAQPIPYPPRP